VVMDQLKEKYGTLHAYYHVEIDPPWYLRIWHKPFDFAYEWIKRKFVFKMKWVTDREGFDEDVLEEIPEGELEKRRERVKNISNVSIEERDGKWYEVTSMYRPPVTHAEPTVHRFAYSMMKLAGKASTVLKFYKEPTSEQLVIRDAVDSIAAELVRDAEKRCYDTCEECGTTIGTEWSPRVQTEGWITYICERCDVRNKIRYALNAIEYDVKDGAVLTDEQTENVNRIKTAVEGDDYVEIEKLKQFLEKLKAIKPSEVK